MVQKRDDEGHGMFHSCEIADEKIAALERTVGEMREDRNAALEFIVGLRDVLIAMQPEMGYRPQQLAFSTKMTDNEILCGRAIESANEFLANSCALLAPKQAEEIDCEEHHG